MKSALRKFRDASGGERRAVVLAGLLLVGARAALLLLPLRTVLSLARRPLRPAAGATDAARLERMVWAVEVMGNRLFPANPCLTQAVVVQALFRRDGRPAELRIGVKREEPARLEAHAWVECDGATVIGAAEAASGYVPLPPFRLRA